MEKLQLGRRCSAVPGSGRVKPSKIGEIACLCEDNCIPAVKDIV